MSLMTKMQTMGGAKKAAASFVPKKTSNAILAVDMNGSILKVAHAKMQGAHAVIQGVASYNLDKGTDEEVMANLIQYFAVNRIAPDQILCNIPSKLFISKNIEIPSTEREEIAKIIDLQAGRFTPYSRDEIVLDFMCMETSVQHYTCILLFIVTRKLIDGYFRVFEKMGIPAKILIASEAMGAVYAEILKSQIPDAGSAYGGLHIGEDASDLTLLDGNQIVYVRSLPIGAEQLRTRKETAIPELMNEFNQSLAGYHDQGIGKPVKLLAITGATQDAAWLKDALLKESPVLQKNGANVILLDYAKGFGLQENVVKQVSSSAPLSFFELFASLTQSSKTKIDLIPKEIKLKRHIRAESKDAINLGIGIMTIFLVVTLFLGTKYYIKKMKVDHIEKLEKSIFEKSRTIERISTKNRVVRKLLRNRGKGLAVFGNLTNFIGEDVYLSSFTYDNTGKLTIVGTADSMSRVFAFVTKLDESKYFGTVTAKETKTRREGQKEIADFTIECVMTQET